MNEVFVHINNMAIQRECIFINGKGYNITDTMAAMVAAHEEHRLNQGVYESIMAQLSMMRFQLHVDRNLFIEHPFTGMYFPITNWFDHFGIEDTTFDIIETDDEDTVATFPLLYSDISSDEECIEDEEEEELVIASHIINEMIREDMEERGMGD